MKFFFSSNQVIHELLEFYKTETILLSSTKFFAFQQKFCLRLCLNIVPNLLD